mgnify:CR=1 FL=1
MPKDITIMYNIKIHKNTLNLLSPEARRAYETDILTRVIKSNKNKTLQKKTQQ